jgi:hypothetical protein
MQEQELVKIFLAYFIRDIKVLKKFYTKIENVSFQVKTVDWVIDRTVQYFKKYGQVPDRDWFNIQIELEEEVFKAQIKVFMEQLYAYDLSKYVWAIEEFTKILAEYFMADLLNSAKIGISQHKDVNKAMQIIESGLSLIKSLNQDVELWDLVGRYKQREAERASRLKNPTKRLLTGIKDFDKQVRMTEGTVTAFLAPFKRYKSILLTNLGYLALLQNFNTLVCPFEGRKQMWEDRFDSRFSGVDYNHLSFGVRSQNEKQTMDQVFDYLNTFSNRLYIMACKPKITTAEDIKQVLINDFDATVVIVDYLNIMGSKRFKNKDDWQSQEELAWDLVRLSEEGKIVLTAVQSKMSGLNAEELTADHTGRSIGIIQSIDNLIGINRTKNEEVEGVIRLSPIVLRDGKITVENIKLETALWKMSISTEMDKAYKIELNDKDFD